MISAAAHGGQAVMNPAQELCFMCSRELADSDRHLRRAFWMDPSAVAPLDRQS